MLLQRSVTESANLSGMLRVRLDKRVDTAAGVNCHRTLLSADGRPKHPDYAELSQAERSRAAPAGPTVNGYSIRIPHSPDLSLHRSAYTELDIAGSSPALVVASVDHNGRGRLRPGTLSSSIQGKSRVDESVNQRRGLGA